MRPSFLPTIGSFGLGPGAAPAAADATTASAATNPLLDADPEAGILHVPCRVSDVALFRSDLMAVRASAPLVAASVAST